MPGGLSAASPASMAPERRLAFLKLLSDDEAAALRWAWEFWARPNQLPPSGDWRVWLILAGRGYGKTRALSEWIRMQIEGGLGRGGLIGRTAGDVRETLVEGESGILAVCPPWSRPQYEPSKRRITWPNGAMVTLYSAEEPDALRGPQHAFLGCDEVATWPGRDAWDQAQFGLRLGPHPRVVAVTTPRPTALIKELVGRPDVHITRGVTWENSANVPPSTLAYLREQYEGTRLGRQELEAEILVDVPGALWQFEMIQEARVKEAPPLKRIVVAIDPAVSSNEDSDETGIVVCGIDEGGDLFVLQDASMRGSPNAWAARAIGLYREWRADRIVAEVNQGGDMVQTTLLAIDRSVAYSTVRASRGKYARAEPIAALYERRRAHHVGKFPQLEEQMLSFTPDMAKSPDRVDALVWASHELVVRNVPLQIFL
ncbi:MAG TPA: terminase family protein [Alphaproteobacteria bacterium]|nr:terminase family protein [Alphaproteobacteria bacterium]